MKTIPVNIKSLEEAFHLDLSQFKNGETYKMIELMNALSFRMPKLRIGIKNNGR